MIVTPLVLHLLAERFAVCRLRPGDSLPPWLPANGVFVAITRTTSELSIVCDETAVPQDVRAERGFRALVVVGPLPFDAVGIMAGITGALAAARIPLLAISTFDTDYVFVRAERITEAVEVLGGRGYGFQE